MGTSATLLRRKDVLRLIGVDATTLWRWRKAGTFPEPIRLTRQTLRWREADVATWLDVRCAKGGAAN